MEDAAFFDCNNAIEDPILWIKGSARCDGGAAFWPTMRLLSCFAMLSASSISMWNTVRSSIYSGYSGVRVPSKFLQRWWNPPASWMHWLTCFEGRRCPTSRRIRKDVMGVPWDSLLDIAWDTLASVRVSRKRERRGCFSFNVRHFQLTDCMLVHDFVLLFIHVWKWFDLLFAGHGEGFVKQKLTTCVWHSVGNSWVWS